MLTLTGDVTGSGSGTISTTIGNNAVTNAKLVQMGAHTYKGNNTGSTANAADITSTQLTADLNLFTSSLQGLAPGSGGGTTNFLRADGTWAAPSGGGGGTIPYMQIGGLIISSIAGTHTTASFSISVGGCTDSTGTAYISPPALSWAASNGNAINGTDASSSTLANSTTYHVFVCKGTSGTGSFVSASLAPTVPTGYGASSRRIGSFTTTSAGAPVPYTSIEMSGGGTINFLSTQVLDIHVTNQGTSRVAYALSVPTGIKVKPIGRSTATHANPVGGLIFTSGDETDVAPSSYSSSGYGAAPGLDVYDGASPNFDSNFPNVYLTTNISGQIGIRGTTTGMAAQFVTRGWEDFRRS